MRNISPSFFLQLSLVTPCPQLSAIGSTVKFLLLSQSDFLPTCSCLLLNWVLGNILLFIQSKILFLFFAAISHFLLIFSLISIIISRSFSQTQSLSPTGGLNFYFLSKKTNPCTVGNLNFQKLLELFQPSLHFWMKPGLLLIWSSGKAEATINKHYSEASHDLTSCEVKTHNIYTQNKYKLVLHGEDSPACILKTRHLSL